MRRKQNNAGFSLIEVILSMAILAIISIPLLSYFTESMKYNAKMADKQHATTLAQEVLEDLKNQDVLVADAGTGETIQYLLDQGYTVISNDMGKTDGAGKFVGGEGVFYGTAGSIGENYDVVVRAQTTPTENTKEIPKISGIDDTSDILALESAQLQEALTHFLAINSAYESNTSARLTSDQIRNKMKRTIGIDIQKDGAYYDVKVSCTYTCMDLRGSGSNDTYECASYAEERLKEVKHIYLLYNVNQLNDTVDITKGSGVESSLNPEIGIICQNMSEVPPAYTITVQGISIPSVTTNLGKNGNNGKVYNSSGIPVTNTKDLVEDKSQIRKITLQVSVYKKGEGNTAGAEPYITVNAAKGE